MHISKEVFENKRPDDKTIEDAAAYFEVSPLLIKSTLVNKSIPDRGVLSGVI